MAEFFAFKKAGQKQLVNAASQFNMCMGDYLFSLLADSDSKISDYLVYDD